LSENRFKDILEKFLAKIKATTQLGYKLLNLMSVFTHILQDYRKIFDAKNYRKPLPQLVRFGFA
jgi:hypothetical protein